MNKIIKSFKKKKYLYIVAIILLIAGGYYWYKKVHSNAAAVQYKTAVAEKGTLTTSVSGSGNVIVDSSANVDPTITGTVSNLVVNVGNKVKKGQLLFSIVNDQLGVSVSQAESSYQSAISSLESAEATYKDTKNSSTSTHADKEAAKSKVESAKSSLQASLVSLNYQKQQSGKRNVTSPINGTVNAVNIKNGDDLSKLSSGSSRQIPMIIGDLETLKAQVQVNEVDIPNVNIGQKSMMTFSAIDGLAVSGKVEKMDSLGTLSSGVVTYNVTISFDTLDPRIKPEMSVSASIITSVKQDIITIPNSAVKTQGGNSYVQVLVSGTPQNKTVEVGASNNTETEITSGINVGDNVITQTITTGATSTSSTSSTSQRTGGGGLRLPGIGGGRPD